MLFLEDVNEPLTGWTAVLLQLRMAGIFDRVGGLFSGSSRDAILKRRKREPRWRSSRPLRNRSRALSTQGFRTVTVRVGSCCPSGFGDRRGGRSNDIRCEHVVMNGF